MYTAKVKSGIIILILLIILLAVTSCTSVPYTDRGQLMLISKKYENEMGEREYKQFIQKSHLTKKQNYIDEVNRVGMKIAGAVNRKDFDWEFAVVDSDNINAFCLPGGKIVVYTGLFKYIKSDNDLATILGHEIGHAIARHSGEDLSKRYIESSLGVGVDVTLGILGIPGIFGSAYSAVTQLGVDLPFSRTQEYEADYIGLMLMAKAGYDPKTALKFWRKFAEESDYGPVKEFFSTHPMGSKRIEDLRKALPKAEKLYYNSKSGINERAF